MKLGALPPSPRDLSLWGKNSLAELPLPGRATASRWSAPYGLVWIGERDRRPVATDGIRAAAAIPAAESALESHPCVALIVAPKERC
jgi:hypothetical protein